MSRCVTLLVANTVFLAGVASSQPPKQQSVSKSRRVESSRPVKPRVYVAPFTSIGAVSPQTLTSLTADFEAALIFNGCYEVLERRDIDQLLNEIRIERRLSAISDLGLPITKDLRGKGATTVMFGQLEDDLNSGEYVLRIKKEDFDSTVAWRGEAQLKHGLLNDRDSRVKMLQKVAGKLCSSGGSIQADSPGAGYELENITRIEQGFRMEIKACYLEGQNLRCPVSVTNMLGTKRCLSVRAEGRCQSGICRNSAYPSAIRDDNDNEFQVASITRGNQMKTGDFDMAFSGNDASVLLLDFHVGNTNMKFLKELSLGCDLCDWTGFRPSLQKVPVLRQAWKR